jgi:putative RNA 2'-phosphotransferase
MKAKKNIVERGKELSFLLRHDKEYAFDEHGWREVADLIERHGYTMGELEEIVATNDKKRYEFSDDKKRIRARQGHSVDVDVELKECVPPDTLYHGTAASFMDSILREGITKQSRLHVHLSADAATAFKVGKRHGTPAVLMVDAAAMVSDGFKFYLSNNGVWLTEYVPTKYLNIVM